MAQLLFKLKGVPESEADEVRALLNEHKIEFYETPPSIWGVSMEAIWLRDEEQLTAARQLLHEYQIALQQRVRQEYEEQRQAGSSPTLWSKIKEDPLQFIVFSVIIALILYLSIKPFMSLSTP